MFQTQNFGSELRQPSLTLLASKPNIMFFLKNRSMTDHIWDKRNLIRHLLVETTFLGLHELRVTNLSLHCAQLLVRRSALFATQERLDQNNVGFLQSCMNVADPTVLVSRHNYYVPRKPDEILKKWPEGSLSGLLHSSARSWKRNKCFFTCSKRNIAVAPYSFLIQHCAPCNKTEQEW